MVSLGIFIVSLGICQVQGLAEFDFILNNCKDSQWWQHEPFGGTLLVAVYQDLHSPMYQQAHLPTSG